DLDIVWSVVERELDKSSAATNRASCSSSRLLAGFTGRFARQRFGGVAAGAGGAAQEVGQQVELLVAVAGAELVHGAVHAAVEAEDRRTAVAPGTHDHGAAVGGVALAGDPAAAFE